ncbi:MAG: DUF4139 domain-containing protein [Candidatus Thermoplasmatota archaeon]
MQRRITLLLVSLSLLATVLAAALVMRPPGSVELSASPSEASHVTLYQNGLAAVRLNRSFNATAPETTLTFALPPTAIYDSVTIEGVGVSVKEIRSGLSQTSGAQPGDDVIVHVGAESYQGTVQAIEGGTLALTTTAGVTYMTLAQVTAIEVQGAARSSAPGSVPATAIVRSEPGQTHNVTLSYLVQGPGWTPSYRLDADTGALTFFATLTASDDWRGVTLDVVSGTPHVIYTPSPQPYRYASRAAGAEAAAPSFAASFSPSTPLGDLHRYHYAGTIDLSRGESARLVLAQGSVDILRHYDEAASSTGWGSAAGDSQDVTVLEKLEIRNALAEPLPAGALRAYRGGEWVGEDTLASTPVGDRANVTLASASEVKAKLTLVSHGASASSDTWTYALTVRNLMTGPGAHPIDLRVAQDFPSYRTTLLRTEPAGGIVTGSRVVWDATLPVGGSLTYSVTYETLKYG